MTAAEIAAALGVSRRSGRWWRCRCPVHNSRGSTLALRDSERGLIICYHAGCEARDVLAQLHRCGLLAGAIGHNPAPIATRSYARVDGAERIGGARRIWNAAHDARRSLVGTPVGWRGVCAATGNSRVQLWRDIQNGRVPAPIEIGPNSLAWPSAEIEAWRESPPRRTYRAPELAEGAAP
jgi:predicted DNA-binding transcriptional regulator AlpA